MTSSNSAFCTGRRALVRISRRIAAARAPRLAVAGVVLALALCLPAAGHSTAVFSTSSATSAAAEEQEQQAALSEQEQQAAQSEQEQAGSLHDPDRGRDRPEMRDRAQLMLSPATSVLAIGDELNVRLFVVGAEALLRLPATLHYDPRVVRVVSVRAGSAWEKGTAPTLLYDTSRPGELVVGLARLGREVAPITGAGELLRVTFEAVAPGETELALKRFALLGRRAQSQRVEARTAKVSVQ